MKSAAVVTFVVFSWQGALVGAPADAIESVSADTDSQGSLTALTPAGRLLRVRAHGNMPAQPLRAHGSLSVVTVPKAQIFALPRLCTSAHGAVTAVALLEDKVLFLIIDPLRLLDLRASGESALGHQELQ